MEGERVAGTPLHFSFRESEGAPFDGEMTRFDPPAVLELRWGEDGTTILRGLLPDQAALHGVLARVRDLGVPLVAVTRLKGPTAKAPPG